MLAAKSSGMLAKGEWSASARHLHVSQHDEVHEDVHKAIKFRHTAHVQDSVVTDSIC